MPWPVHPNGLLGAQGDNDSYQISRSLRFNSADSAYLSRTPSASNRKTWTWSGWVKRSSISSASISGIFSATAASPSDNTNLFSFGFNTTDTLIIGGGASTILETSQVFRDPSAWYHIVLAFDTTQATLSNRIKLYINGTQVTSFSTASYVTQDFQLAINSAVQHTISSLLPFLARYFDGYITEVNFIDGIQLTPSSFGETDAITGRWKAKAYSGTYGTNGFYLKFADNSGTTSTTLGKDSSGNGNNWTPNNFSITAGAGNDSLVDSPTNYGGDSGVGGELRGNYATLNPLWNYSSTLSNGNMDWATSTVYGQCASSFAVNSGKWYWEVTGVTVGYIVGIMDATSNPSADWGGVKGYYSGNGDKYLGNTASAYSSSFAAGDVIGCALNMDSGTLVFYKNNTSQGTAFTGISGFQYPCFLGGDGSAGLSAVINTGKRPFAYTAPTGFKALCTTNLSTPTIKKTSSYFDAVTYTGTGATQTISSLEFSPDLLWTKGRSLAQSHNLFDTLRSGQRLRSDTTGAEASTTVTLGSNGFTLGVETENNNSGSTFVAWAWDKSPKAGVDIVTFTGTSATQNVSHSLGVAPKMVIYKCRNTAVTSWVVGHSSVNSGSSPWNYYMVLNASDAQAASANAWNNTAPTSTQFTVGGAFTPLTFTYIAYAFAEIDGFSKFGLYTGNSSANGPFIYCGFRPKLIISKRTDAVENWIIYDTSRDSFNVSSAQLQPNTSIAETTANSLIDINSNGFKFRTSNAFNGNAGTNIFMAFAESPFKYARAR
jgi:hypothetical protein